jgi:Smg protein
MTTSVLDVLSFLFEHYIEDDGSEFDREAVAAELARVGFEPARVSAAFEWLEGLSDTPSDFRHADVGSRSFRIFSADETRRLSHENRGFLLFLEEVGVIDARTRERVIDRVMALDTEDLDLDQLKWIVLMVLFNQPDSDGPAAWMERLVMDDLPGSVH